VESTFHFFQILMALNITFCRKLEKMLNWGGDLIQKQRLQIMMTDVHLIHSDSPVNTLLSFSCLIHNCKLWKQKVKSYGFYTSSKDFGMKEVLH
jgi:hypothetical protein